MTNTHEKKTWLNRLKQYFQYEPETQKDLLQLLRDAQGRTLIDAETLSMLEGVMLFVKMRVRDIMLPKKQMVSIPENATLNEVITLVRQSGHSRFPVLGTNPDEIIGTVHAKDLLRFQGPNPLDFDLTEVTRHATVVPESKRLDMLLSDFRINRNHMAIVVDEYGAASGFVTLEDVIEQIIGDIADEFDIDEEAHIKAHGDAHYMINADTPIDEFNQTLNASLSDETYDTIGGIVMAEFGHLPGRGEKITVAGFQFTVVNADARHIKLLECIDNRMENLAV
ncbi:MAG: transporter associated domain-containing protein [Legionellaceae bacterium]|nr:transporter associated domain-containing protein [Legionellaceae bacterium]